MKKLLIGAAVAALAAFGASEQVMPASGVENTLWTGLGSPFSGDAKYFGFVDTLQARVDVGKFTVEGMLNWGALSYWDYEDDGFDKLVFKNTETNALNRHYYDEYKNTVNYFTMNLRLFELPNYSLEKGNRFIPIPFLLS